MAWIELHQTLREHKKLFKCADLLGLTRVEMMGTLVSLWLWALDNAQDGLLLDISDRTIARVCDFPEKKAGKLVESLRSSGWLDYDEKRSCLVIHDWYDYAGKLMERREKDRRRKGKSEEKPGKTTGNSTDIPASFRWNSSGIPSEEPGNSCATVPNRTVPNQTSQSRGINTVDGCAPPAEGKAFTRFWESYPNGENRAAAWEAWKALNPSAQTVAEIMAGLDAWKKSERWLDDNGRFIPHAVTWLKDTRWKCPPPAKGTGARGAVPAGASGTFGQAELEAIQQVLAQDYGDLPPVGMEGCL